MIELLGRDDYSSFGLAAVLDVEKIPYRRIGRIDDTRGGLLIIAAHDLSAAEAAAAERTGALVVGGGERFAREVFGADGARVEDASCTMALDEPVWPAHVRELARAFGKSELRLPLAPICRVGDLARGEVLAALPSGVAVAQHNRCTWSLVDLGAAFANLITERYLPRRQVDSAPSALKSVARKMAEAVYYAAPDRVRRQVQRRAYAALERRLAGDAQVSEYPIDATGWLLIELVKSLIKRTAGSLVRVARWPAPYRAAASLTHDVEPRRFAYTKGLQRLLDAVATSGHPATLGLVAGAAARHLGDDGARRLAGHGVLVHGLEHRGENVDGRAAVVADLGAARGKLEHRLGRRVAGYRSPRLDRSPDLAWALDRTGFRYDSSYPDVDRENIAHFGAGVRVNVPYRPPLEDDGMLRPSACLELPLTAPDCIQPLFAGDTMETLQRTVAAKAAFLRATGGLYVALVHGGVFGEKDAELRSAHLEFVCRQLRHGDVWLAGMAEVADWWCAREALRVRVDGDTVQVANEGAHPIAGARVVVERAPGEVTLEVPTLAPGARLALPVASTTALPAA